MFKPKKYVFFIPPNFPNKKWKVASAPISIGEYKNNTYYYHYTVIIPINFYEPINTYLQKFGFDESTKTQTNQTKTTTQSLLGSYQLIHSNPRIHVAS